MKKDLRDLGFGTSVRTEKGGRLIDANGDFNVHRHGMPLRAMLSLSHRLLTMSWVPFLGLLTAAYFGLNAIFGLSFHALGPDAIQGPGEPGFVRCFFFSVQTASTIGYGHLTPGSESASLLASVEALVSLIAFALVTGLVYARFTRPMADIAFSEHAIIAPYRDMTSLQFRIANQRKSQLLELHARVFLTRVVQTGETAQRSFDELSLERDELAFFPLSWTVVHPIDESSPLAGTTREELIACDAEILVTLSGIDETFSHNVYARTSYKASEVVWNARFANIFERDEHGNAAAVHVGRVDEFQKLD